MLLASGMYVDEIIFVVIGIYSSALADYGLNHILYTQIVNGLFINTLSERLCNSHVGNHPGSYFYIPDLHVCNGFDSKYCFFASVRNRRNFYF